MKQQTDKTPKICVCVLDIQDLVRTSFEEDQSGFFDGYESGWW